MRISTREVKVELRVRQMLPTDAEAVVDFLSRFPECAMQPNENARLLVANMARHEGCCWVGMELVDGKEEDVVGAILASAGVTRGLIEHVATDPSIRKCGMGSRLVLKVQKAFRLKFGLQRVHALITKGNPAIGFWCELNYATPDGEVAVYRGQPPPHVNFGLGFVEGDEGTVAAAADLEGEDFDGTRVHPGDATET